MAQAAPGFVPEHKEPPCYNCGIRGHMFTACPEEPRKVPAGLEASWARQQSSNSPHNDSPMLGKRGKGPVITRYPPPLPPATPHRAPPIPRYENPPAQPYQPGPVPGYPPQPSYSSGYGRPPPPNPTYDRYGPPGPSGPSGPPGPPPPPPPGPHQPFNPPAYHHAYNAAYGPPGPVHGHYDHPHGPPPGRPGQYYPNDYPTGAPNRPGRYPPGQYPPPLSGPPGPPGPALYGTQPHYPSGPPPMYPPPPTFAHPPAPYGYPGPPGPPIGYPQPEYNPPQQGPPPTPYHQLPPSDLSHGPPYGGDRNRHQRDRDYLGRYDNRRPAEAWHHQDAWHNSPPNDQPYRDEYREDWHGKPFFRDDRHSRRWGHNRPTDERRRDRHDRFHPYRNSDKPDRHHRRRQQPATTPMRTAPREWNSPDRETPKIDKVEEDREPGEIVSEPNSPSNHGDTAVIPDTLSDKEGDDCSWDEHTIFLESTVSSKVDPIAAPLPTEYSNDVMMPPAFDAKALKSRYITPRNVDDFAQSIRETRDWQVMQHHPAFLDPMDIRLEKLDDYERAIEKDTAIKSNRRDRPNNTHDIGRHRHGNAKGSGRHYGKSSDLRYKLDQKKRRWNDFQGDADPPRMEKWHRDFPYDDDSFSKRFRPTSPEPGEVIEDDPQSPPYEPTPISSVPISVYQWAPEPEVSRDLAPQLPDVDDKSSESDGEVKNGQLNTPSLHDRDKSNARSPTPLADLADTPPQRSRPPSRQSSRSFRKSRSNSRRSSVGSQRSCSPGSSLDPIERELLGLGGPENSGSDTDGETPKRQLNNATPKFKRRQPMVEAYSRRW
ncbi:hypothetical protein GGR54DRAFT_141655 [Hypoxylon sp. NC1633]|nr:hypothetical protein GGR54DRAFT_141655 [Hypoxylon sp. NC1633]